MLATVDVIVVIFWILSSMFHW